ncbi:MAG TPA: hypothetical protein VIQ02_01205 [Jiangellaceae bacterium]
MTSGDGPHGSPIPGVQMLDVIFVGLIVLFFATVVLFAKGLERL